MLKPGISETTDGYLVRIYRKGRTISAHVSKTTPNALRVAKSVHKAMSDKYPRATRQRRRPCVYKVFRKTGNGWRVIYYVGPDQKRKSKTFSTEYEAREFAKRSLQNR